MRKRNHGLAYSEYALLLGLVSVVGIVSVTSVGTQIAQVFDSSGDRVAASLDDTGDGATDTSPPDQGPGVRITLNDMPNPIVGEAYSLNLRDHIETTGDIAAADVQCRVVVTRGSPGAGTTMRDPSYDAPPGMSYAPGGCGLSGTPDSTANFAIQAIAFVPGDGPPPMGGLPEVSDLRSYQVTIESPDAPDCSWETDGDMMNGGVCVVDDATGTSLIMGVGDAISDLDVRFSDTQFPDEDDGVARGDLIQANTTAQIGSGSGNSAAILGLSGNQTAAEYCNTLTKDGFSDWTLPAYDTLLAINGVPSMESHLDLPESLDQVRYWSSSVGLYRPEDSANTSRNDGRNNQLIGYLAYDPRQSEDGLSMPRSRDDNLGDDFPAGLGDPTQASARALCVRNVVDSYPSAEAAPQFVGR